MLRIPQPLPRTFSCQRDTMPSVQGVAHGGGRSLSLIAASPPAPKPPEASQYVASTLQRSFRSGDRRSSFTFLASRTTGAAARVFEGLAPTAALAAPSEARGA